jgi:erythritol kinase (D-erythritol 1-phosphate-forming)
VQRRTRVILGIDAGTTSVKTVAFTLTGQILTVARSTIHLERPSPGWVEADMDRIWDATASTISAVVEQLGDADIVAVGITGQGDGAWFVDARRVPVRPAALWPDGRSAARLEDWLDDGRAQAVHDATGSPLFPGALPLLVDEILAAQPELRERVAHQLNCKDWLRYKLTGRIATDPSEASRTYLDTATGKYSEELLRALGQEDMHPKLPEVLAPESVAGTVDSQIAFALGLPAGIPVAVGMVDTAASGVGLGVLGNGRGYVILGTTGFVGVNHASRSEARVPTSILLATGRGPQVLESLAPMTGTPNLDWVRSCLGLAGWDWSEVEVAACEVVPGSGGVLYLPYGATSGERAPFHDANASAAWLGMSVTTSSGQLLRSVYEGLAYSLVECLKVLGLEGPLAVCGGGSDSDLFCTILADVSGRVVLRQEAPEVGARGAAVLAGVAAGDFPNLESAVENMVPAMSSFEPNPQNSETYQDAYRTFIATRDALRPHWPQLRALRHHSPTPTPTPTPAATGA